MDTMMVALKLFIAIVCGAVIGLEREIHEKAAGLRTHILVCMGACLFAMIGLSLVSRYNTADPLRIAQGILIGIGFLGGGVIMKEGASIVGLTTAAGIWVMGAIGLAIGVGKFQMAFLGTLFSFLTISLFGKVEKLLKK